MSFSGSDLGSAHGTIVLAADLRGIAATQKGLATLQKQSAAFSKQFAANMKAVGDSATKAGAVLSVALTTPIVAFAKNAITASSDFAEAMSAVQTVFGASADTVVAFSKDSVAALYLTETQILSTSATLGNLYKGMGLTEDAAAGLSAQVITMAADFASFNNVPVDVAMDKIKSALAGQGEGIRDFGIFMGEAEVEAEGLRLGLIEQGQTMTENEKVIARQSFIYTHMGDQMGDAGRTAGSFSNSVKILQDQLAELSREIGDVLTPVIAPLVTRFTELVKQFRESSPEMKRWIVIAGGIAAALGPALIIFGQLTKALALLSLPLALVIAGVALLAAAWANNWLGIRDITEKVVARIGEFIGRIVEFFTHARRRGLEAFDLAMRTLIVSLGEQFGADNPVVEFLQGILRNGRKLSRFITEDLIPAVVGIVDAIKAGDWVGAGALVGGVFDDIKGGWDKTVGPWLEELKAFGGTLLQNIWTSLQGLNWSQIAATVITGIGNFKDSIIGPALQSLLAFGGSALQTIMTSLRGVNWVVVKDTILAGLGQFKDEVLVPALEGLLTFGAQVLQQVMASFDGLNWDAVWQAIVAGLATINDEVVQPAIAGLLTFGAQVLQTLTESFSGLNWSAIWNEIVAGLGTLKDQVVSPTISGLLIFGAQVLQQLTESFKGLNWSAIWTAITDGLGTLKDEAIAPAIAGLKTFGAQILSQLIASFQGVNWIVIWNEIVAGLGVLKDQVVSPAVTGLKTFGAEVLQQLVTSFQGLNWSAIWNEITTGLGQFKDEKLTPAIGSLLTFGQQVLQQLTKSFAGLNWDALWLSIVAGLGTLKDKVIVPGITSVAQFGQKIVDEAVLSVKKVKWEDLKQQILAGLNTALQGLLGFGAKVVQTLATTFEGVNWDLIWNQIFDGLGDLGTWTLNVGLPTTWAIAVDFKEQLSAKLIAALVGMEELTTWSLTVGTPTTLTVNTEGIFAAIMNRLTTAAQSPGPAFVTAAGQLGTTLGQGMVDLVIAGINTAFAAPTKEQISWGELVTGAGGAQDVKGSIGDAFANFDEEFTKAITDALAAVDWAKLATDLGGRAKDLLGALAFELSGIENITAIFTVLQRNITSAAKLDWGTILKDAGTKLIGGFISAAMAPIDQFVLDVKAKMEGLAALILGVSADQAALHVTPETSAEASRATGVDEPDTSAIQSRWEAAGRAKGEGIIAGQEAVNPAVIKSQDDVLDQQWDAAAENLDIHSPSGKYEILGLASGQGYAQGLEGATPDVGQAAKNLIDIAVSQVNAGNQEIAAAAVDTANIEKQYLKDVERAHITHAQAVRQLQHDTTQTVRQEAAARRDAEKQVAEQIMALDQQMADARQQAADQMADIAQQRQQIEADTQSQLADAEQQFNETSQQNAEARRQLIAESQAAAKDAAKAWAQTNRDILDQIKDIRKELRATLQEGAEGLARTMEDLATDATRVQEDLTRDLARNATEQQRLQEDLAATLVDPGLSAEQRAKARIDAARRLADLQTQAADLQISAERQLQDIQTQRQREDEDFAAAQASAREDARNRERELEQERKQAQQDYHKQKKIDDDETKAQLGELKKAMSDAAKDLAGQQKDIRGDAATQIDDLIDQENSARGDQLKAVKAIEDEKTRIVTDAGKDRVLAARDEAKAAELAQREVEQLGRDEARDLRVADRDKRRAEAELTGKDVGAAIGTGTAAGLKATESQVGNAGDNVAASASSGLAAAAGKARTDGVNMATSFISGLRSQTSAARSAGQAVADAAEQGMRDSAEMRSPSKVWQEMGRTMGTSLAAGLAETAPLLAGAAGTLGDPGWKSLATSIASDRQQRGVAASAVLSGNLAATVVIEDKQLRQYVLGTAIAPMLQSRDRASAGSLFA